MNKTTEALKLAEEALQDCMEKFYAMKSTGVIGALPSQAVKAAATLAAIREALAEHQDKPAECANGCPENTVCDYCQRAEPVKQEPVAYMFKVKRTTKAITVLDEFAAIDYFPQDNEEIISKEPLSYAAPVDRQWVDLTDDEKVMLSDRLNLDRRIVVIDAVIAAFKEKNK